MDKVLINGTVNELQEAFYILSWLGFVAGFVFAVFFIYFISPIISRWIYKWVRFYRLRRRAYLRTHVFWSK